jgi:DNA polymerase III subunit delta
VAYCGAGAITRADVEAVVPESAEYSIFTLVDAVSEGNAALALQTLRGLRARNEPVHRILALLARQVRLVWEARLLMEDRDGHERLPREPDLTRLPPFVQNKAKRQAQRFSWPKLQRALRLILDRDLALKGVEGPPVDEDEALETLIIALCRP